MADHEREHARLLAVWMWLSFAMILGLAITVNVVMMIVDGYRDLTLAATCFCLVGLVGAVRRTLKIWKSFDA